ncbi:FAD/NAD(P)-binding domain-containing protein [Lophiostoma macrostomum CBS 122681]|uniref:FAD/NAD(P)-binding domain-containing protein n=1 Tax=Lophiostoma macrostomum CBS 122681 TaxID=1314788 RepID=A0A6A6SRS7_9PLEO|nr:FAD/NAD(P)-binding domain-containing protein [Lophiostoma macrostomum CBS 122681]
MISIRARTVAIIGAGPSGVTAAKYLRAEKAFDKIVVFEQRSRCGGIWNYTPDLTDEDVFSIPQTSPLGKGFQDPAWRSATTGGRPGHVTNGSSTIGKEGTFLSPIYERLETNIPRGLMGFQDLDWPQDSQLFPKHETVLEYIEKYAEDIQDLVSYDTQVVAIEPCTGDESWEVCTRELRSGTETTETYDAVIVANGHFIIPYVPDIPGIREWNAKHPSTITHSKYFRTAEEFSDKKVVVVGNSASGVDISTQIASVAQQPVLWSSRSSSMLKPQSDARKREHPPIHRLLPDTRGVEFEDGVVETGIDTIVFATGYFYSLPFLKNISPPLVSDGSHVQHTYQHLFYAPRPTLSFLVLNQRVIPFPVAEAQSAVLARVYSGRLQLPSLSEMQKWEQQTIDENGNGKNFHLLPFPKDANYINQLSTWAMSAVAKESLENHGKGKMPPRWGEWEFWCRENFPAIRAAFGARGEARYDIRSLKELGFDYEEHLAEKERGGGKMC